MGHLSFVSARVAAATAARCLALTFILSAARLPAQQSGQPTQPQLPSAEDQLPNNSREPDPEVKRMLAQAAERRNGERQKQLVADTGKLLLLAQELQSEVDKSNKETLSISVIKKAEEIEKLAKSVREKMKGP